MSWPVILVVVAWVVIAHGLYVRRARRRDARVDRPRSIHVVFETVDGVLVTRDVQPDLVTIFDFPSPVTRVTIVSSGSTAPPSARSFDDRCRPVSPAYYEGGPVTPMSREEAEEDRRVLSRRCSRGTRGCFLDHVPETDLPNPGERTT